MGRDQADRIASQAGEVLRAKTNLIRQCADLEAIEVQPVEGNAMLAACGLDSPAFTVFQFAGNIGPLQNVDFLASAIAAAQHIDGARFLFVGDGRRKAFLREQVRAQDLDNLVVLDAVDRSRAAELHSACHVAIVSLVPGMSGVSVPSRIGNILAGGRPILAPIDADSELARLISEEDIGWCVSPNDVQGFLAAVAEAVADPDKVEAMAMRARDLAEREFSEQLMHQRYAALVTEA